MIRMWNVWGRKLEAISLRTDIEREERLREVGRVLIQLIQELSCPDATQRSPDGDSAAQIWQANTCPMRCTQTGVLEVWEDYPRARFGVVVDKDGNQKVLQVLIHRISCWAARGDPSPTAPYATHCCGIKQCVRLGCLSWGNDSSNQLDAYQLAAGKRRARWVPNLDNLGAIREQLGRWRSLGCSKPCIQRALYWARSTACICAFPGLFWWTAANSGVHVILRFTECVYPEISR